MSETKTKMITTRITENEQQLLEQLEEKTERDRSGVVRFAIRHLWWALFMNEQDPKDMLH